MISPVSASSPALSIVILFCFVFNNFRHSNNCVMVDFAFIKEFFLKKLIIM